MLSCHSVSRILDKCKAFIDLGQQRLVKHSKAIEFTPSLLAHSDKLLPLHKKGQMMNTLGVRSSDECFRLKPIGLSL